MTALQSLSDNSYKEVINQISKVSRSAHHLTVMALAVASVALAVAITSFVSVNPMLILFWTLMETVFCRGQLRCIYTNHIEDAANQVKVVRGLKAKHKRIEYHAPLTRNQNLETLKTQVTLILHTTGMARLDYGPQQIIEFTYGSVRGGLLITDVIKGSTTNCDCSFNDDIKVTSTNLWPTGPIFSKTNRRTSRP